MTADDARSAVQRMAALSGGPEMTRVAAGRLLGKLAPAEAAELLHHVIALSQSGWAPASTVLPAFTRALQMEGEHIPYLDSLRQVAGLLRQQDVEALFAHAPAQREYSADAAARADAKILTDSLGHLKTRARLTRNPDELARLAVVSNPAVIRNVLINPRLTEDVVVRIAARRPARPEPLVEIWKSQRWSVRPAVRKALVFNPYLPVDTASKIVPLLAVGELRELKADSGLHVRLRAQAEQLLAMGER